MSDQCYYAAFGIELGPVPLATIRDLLAQGVLGPGDRFCIAGQPWRDVAELTNQSVPSAFDAIFASSPVVPIDSRESKPKSSSPDEAADNGRWYYRTMTGVVGPITTEEFIQAIHTQSVTPQTSVRLTENGEWMVAADIDGLEFPRDQSVAPQVPAAAPAPSKETAKQRPPLNREMRELFIECARHQKPAVARKPARKRIDVPVGYLGSILVGLFKDTFSVAFGIVNTIVDRVVAAVSRAWQSRITQISTLILLLALLVPNISALLVTQRYVHACLASTLAEFKDLRSRDVGEETWRQFRQTSLQKLSKLVPQLEARADVRDRASLVLLGVARDDLPKLLNAQDKEWDEIEQKIESRLSGLKSRF